VSTKDLDAFLEIAEVKSFISANIGSGIFLSNPQAGSKRGVSSNQPAVVHVQLVHDQPAHPVNGEPLHDQLYQLAAEHDQPAHADEGQPLQDQHYQPPAELTSPPCR
jgi:hypothetical protein